VKCPRLDTEVHRKLLTPNFAAGLALLELVFFLGDPLGELDFRELSILGLVPDFLEEASDGPFLSEAFFWLVLRSLELVFFWVVGVEADEDRMEGPEAFGALFWNPPESVLDWAAF